MADALDSKSSARKGVWVRLPPLVLAIELRVPIELAAAFTVNL